MSVSTMNATVSSKSTTAATITMDRRRQDRRTQNNGDASRQPATTRRLNQRRRHIDPTTCERDYSDREVEFMKAMDEYKHSSGRMFPTCSEVLEVLNGLGYVQLNDDQFAQLGLDAEVDHAYGDDNACDADADTDE